MSTSKWSLKAHIGVGALSSPLEIGADRAVQAAEEMANLLTECGCETVQGGAIGSCDQAVAAGRRFTENHVDAVALVSTSWYEDYLALDLLEECSVPVLLWALPGMETGALCCNQQLTAYLNQLDAWYYCAFGPLADAPQMGMAQQFLQAAALKSMLRRARVGFAGHQVAGMTEVAANEIALKKTIGPRIVPIDLPSLLGAVEQTADSVAQEDWDELKGRASRCEVSKGEGLDSIKVCLAIEKVVEEYGLDALAVGCYPHLMGRVCMAASLLADRGVPLGCEGDVNGAVAQLILTRLTGQPTHNTDWLEPLEDGTVVFTHCGSGSFSLAENDKEITLAPVRLMNQGVCALFTAKPGPVTLINLVPRGAGYQLAILEGQAISTDMVFPGNPLRVRLQHPTEEIILWIHEHGIGHHWMAGYGSVAGTIRYWADMAHGDLTLIEPKT